MIKNLTKRLFRKFLKKLVIAHCQLSYSQFGEDLIIANLFYKIGLHKPFYLDIGANEPKFISNTYYFYERGGSGVLIEPNPHLYRKIRRQRPKDKVLNVGIGVNEVQEANFYMFPNYANGLSTFSESEARHWQEIGMKGLGKIPLEKIIKLPLVPINSILEKYFSEREIDILSLDVEGLDFDILETFDFSRYQPKIICVETLEYDDDQNGIKNNKIIEYITSKNYVVYADTRVNTIFCRKDILQ
jgi:FkbM family methyltransferase